MGLIRPSFSIALMNIRKWLINPRIYILLLLLFIILYDPCSEITAISMGLGIKGPPYLFPMIVNDQFIRLFINFGLIMLLCDAPFVDTTRPFIIIRSRKRLWALGQFVYIFVSSAIYLFTIFFLTIIMTIPSLGAGDDWGELFFTINRTGVSGRISPVIMREFSPFWALFQSLILGWLSFVFLGMLIFAINILFNQTIGSIVAAGLVLLSGEQIPILKWILPTSLQVVGSLNVSGTSGRPSLVYAYFYILLLIVALIGVNLRIVRVKEIGMTPAF